MHTPPTVAPHLGIMYSYSDGSGILCALAKIFPNLWLNRPIFEDRYTIRVQTSSPVLPTDEYVYRRSIDRNTFFIIRSYLIGRQFEAYLQPLVQLADRYFDELFVGDGT